MSTPLVEVLRSRLVDGIHRGDLAVVSADGRMVAAVGDPHNKIAFWRSAAKPFQALPVVYSGAAQNRLTGQCDRPVTLPDKGEDRRPEEIPISAEMTTQEIGSFVQSVQRRTRSWGIAVDGGYWKPSLSVEVAKGAEDRFAELQGVLRGSGIEVQRKIR